MDNSSEIKDIWLKILTALESKLGLDAVDLWLRPIKPLVIEDGVFKLEVPSPAIHKTVTERYEAMIVEAALEVTGKNFSINYSLSLAPSEPKAAPRVAPSREEAAQRHHGSAQSQSFAFNPIHTFDTFIEGASNRFAFASAVSIAKNPGKSNPFFIYSAPGLGKTHLLHAIANEMLRANPGARILYTASENFVNEYIEHLQNKTPETFRRKYRMLDCILLDDIQFLIGKDKSGEEFFHTFNSLFETKKQIVVTSDRPPKELALEQRLVSRFLAGLAVDIKMPDLETRIAILRQKKEIHKFDIPDDVMNFIAEKVKKNIRELEGCLITVGNYCANMEVQASIDIVREVIKDHISQDEQEERRINIDVIKTVVSEKYSLDKRDFTSPKKTGNIVLPRQIAMFLACSLTEMSLPEIGSAFNRDHTTVIYARDKITQMTHSDPYFNELLNQLIARVKAVNNSSQS